MGKKQCFLAKSDMKKFIFQKLNNLSKKTFLEFEEQYIEMISTKFQPFIS